MDCSEFLKRYSEYDDSLITPADLDRFRSHMALCEACTRYDRVLRKGRMLARQVPDVETSSDFVPRLHMRLWEECGIRARAARRPAETASALAAVTVLLVAAATLGILARDHTEGPRTAAAAVDPSATRVAGGGRAGNALLASGSAASAAGHVLSRRSLPLPSTAGAAEPRPWAVERVDRDGQSSYSPLVTGPPQYRGGRPYSGASISAYRTLD